MTIYQLMFTSGDRMKKVNLLKYLCINVKMCDNSYLISLYYFFILNSEWS